MLKIPQLYDNKGVKEECYFKELLSKESLKLLIHM